ncbi:hypothetical protein PGTUg99_008846 [Puccinia graminis f. sp. tritici]|uniref:Uncharacterized protein n=1 Tax=Puccinia graminis f. sp. tritici TaxID=56615 RepID=A0A5B0MRF7_PUCGR|nr:hypothetical protein PGTUg99_008846 [Puccinia graminis f. sp. tritici]
MFPCPPKCSGTGIGALASDWVRLSVLVKLKLSSPFGNLELEKPDHKISTRVWISALSRGNSQGFLSSSPGEIKESSDRNTGLTMVHTLGGIY